MLDDSPCQNLRMFGNRNNFSCHVDFIVNQICRFASTTKKKPRANLTVPCHRHPTEEMEKTESDTWAVYHRALTVRYKISKF